MSLNTILATTPLTSTNYILKATGTTIGNSLIWDNGTNVGIGNQGTTYTLDVSGTGRFTGNVGIGATLSAWISTAKALQLNDTASLFGPTSEAILANNLFVDSTDNNKYITTNFASQYRQVNGQHIFYSAASGTAGTTISFGTPKLIISSAGNVGIGTSSPSGLLQVGVANSGIYIDTTTQYTPKIIAAGTISDIQIQSVGNGGNVYLNAPGTTSLITMSTNGAERMRITSNGTVGIGITTGTYNGRLCIEGAGSSTSNVHLELLTDTNRSYIQSANRTFIANAPLTIESSSITLVALGSGAVTATSGVLSTTSDMNLKIEDGYIDNALEKVLKLIPRYFLWKEESGLPTDLRQLGFYAQEVNEALGEEVANTPKDENQSWGIYDRGIIAMLTKAIQEQQIQIQNLQEQINILAK